VVTRILANYLKRFEQDKLFTISYNLAIEQLVDTVRAETAGLETPNPYVLGITIYIIRDVLAEKL
jgi:hypothetical protein